VSDSEHQEIYQKGQSNREEKWEVLRENRKDLRVRMTSFKDTLFLKKYQAAAPPLCCFFIFNFLVLLLHAVFWVLRLLFLENGSPRERESRDRDRDKERGRGHHPLLSI
jgi:hypothetical protein